MSSQEIKHPHNSSSEGGVEAVRGVAGALISDGKILLVKRSPRSRFYPNVWDLFGGHVEGTEALEDALRCEAFEELQVKIKSLRKIGTIYDPVEPAEVSVFVVSGWVGEPTNAAPDEHSEIRWFATGKMPISIALDGYGDLINWAVEASLDDPVATPNGNTGGQQ